MHLDSFDDFSTLSLSDPHRGIDNLIEWATFKQRQS